MRVYFNNVAFFMRSHIKRVLNFALHYLHQPSDGLETTVSMVTEEEIRFLNAQYRARDAVTDVLSFPAVENPSRDRLNLTALQNELDPETGLLNIGDIIICLPRARQQAREFGHSLKRELSFLALHSLLHLLGYDHIEPADEQQMINLQKEILDKLGITRKNVIKGQK